MRTLRLTATGRRRPPEAPENVRKLGWISFANDAASELAYPIVPLFLTITLGAPVAVVGVIEGIAEGLATGVRLLSGWVSDRMGNRRKPWIIGGYGASAVARGALAAAPAWGWVLGARIVDRLGKGARGTPRDALIRDSTPPELRGASFGYHRALDTAGAIVGPLIAVVLLESGLSLRGILWVACGLGAGVLVVLRGVREAPGHAERAAVAPVRVPLPRAFWAALAVWVVFSLGNSSDAFLVLRARDLGLGAVVVVLAYAVYNVIYASLSWPFGAISDRVPRAIVLGAGLGVFTLVYFGFAVASQGWTVWPLFAVYGVYIAATEGVARAWVADALPDKAAVGTAYGVFFMGTAAAAFVASVVAGVLWTYVSPRAPFVVGASAGLLALLLLVAFEAGWEARSRSIKWRSAGSRPSWSRRPHWASGSSITGSPTRSRSARSKRCRPRSSVLAGRLPPAARRSASPPRVRPTCRRGAPARRRSSPVSARATSRRRTTSTGLCSPAPATRCFAGRSTPPTRKSCSATRRSPVRWR